MVVVREGRQGQRLTVVTRPIDHHCGGEARGVAVDGQAHPLALRRVDNLKHSHGEVAPEPKRFGRMVVTMANGRMNGGTLMPLRASKPNVCNLKGREMGLQLAFQISRDLACGCNREAGVHYDGDVRMEFVAHPARLDL